MGNDYIKENLLDASPYKKQQDEAKALVGKWDKTGLLEGLNDDFQKSGINCSEFLLKMHVSFLVCDRKPEKVIITPDFCQFPTGFFEELRIQVYR